MLVECAFYELPPQFPFPLCFLRASIHFLPLKLIIIITPRRFPNPHIKTVVSHKWPSIQGEVIAAQNYTCIIDNLDDLVYSNATSHVHNVSLHIIRYSLKETKPTIPTSVSDHVFFNQDPDYVDYQAYLSGISAFLSAFADEKSLAAKSQSWVPASAMARIPLLVTRELLQWYSYLTAGDMYVQENYEREVDMI